MNGVSFIRGPGRTWRGRVRPALTGGGVPDRDEAAARRDERVVVRPRRDDARRRQADATTAYFVQLLDQPRSRGLKADMGLRREWAEAYRAAHALDRPRFVRTADEHV